MTGGERPVIGRTLNHYTILESLGSGGMGEVWLAEDAKLHRRVALKVLPESMASNPDRRARFEREARAVAALNHPNIVTIHSVETCDGIHFITMEAVMGRTLTALIPSKGMSLPRFLEIALPLADAVGAAHESGIVHRDLKPDNLIVSDRGVLKVLDFGLAKLQDAGSDEAARSQLPTAAVTAEGKIIGTVAYMSPEQAEGKPIDARSDVFSLGIVLYQMATGRRPFTGDSTLSTLSSILKEQPRPITDHNASLPRDLSRIISRCLAKSPAERFSTAQGLRSELAMLKQESDSGILSAPRLASRRGAWHARWVIPAAVACLILAAASWGAWRALHTAPGGPPLPEPPAVPADRAGVVPAQAKIVVLPFKNLGPDDEGYFAAGIADEITSRLASVAGIAVISTTSARHYQDASVPLRQIGQELGVTHVVEGTVRWDREGAAEGRVRVTPRLIRVADDTQIWSEGYDRTLEDIFEVQSEIAAAVVGQLGVSLGGAEARALAAVPTKNMEAYRSYLEARELARVFVRVLEESRRRMDLLDKSVALDPDFALAWAELSRAHSQWFHDAIDPSEGRLARARTAVDRALAIDPELPEARVALGYYYYHGRRDYDRALKEFAHAAEGRPPSSEVLAAVGYIRRRLGAWEGAIESLREAWALDPRNSTLTEELWSTYCTTRRWDDAEPMCPALGDDEEIRSLCHARVAWGRGDLAAARKATEGITRPHIPFTTGVLWMIQRLSGNHERALAWAERTEADLIPYQLGDKRLLRAISLEDLGRVAEAREAYTLAVQALEERRNANPSEPRARQNLALAYAGLGRREEAIREATLAADMMPLEKDALDGPDFLETLARVLARFGESDRALDIIEQLLAIPSDLSVMAVEHDPDFAPLRGSPRYARIVAAAR